MSFTTPGLGRIGVETILSPRRWTELNFIVCAIDIFVEIRTEDLDRQRKTGNIPIAICLPLVAIHTSHRKTEVEPQTRRKAWTCHEESRRKTRIADRRVSMFIFI